MLHRHPEPIQLEDPTDEEFAEHALREEEDLELELEARYRH